MFQTLPLGTDDLDPSVRKQLFFRVPWCPIAIAIVVGSGWWFGTWLLFSIIYGMSSFPLTNFYILQDGYCTTNQVLLLTIINHILTILLTLPHVVLGYNGDSHVLPWSFRRWTLRFSPVQRIKRHPTNRSASRCGVPFKGAIEKCVPFWLH